MSRYFFYFFSLSSSFLYGDFFSFQTIDRAITAYNRGAFQESVQLFKGLEGKGGSVFYNEGNAYYKLGMYDRALACYSQASGVNEAILFYNMGNSYFKKKEFDEAIKFYKKSLRLKRDDDTQKNLELAIKKEENSKNKIKKSNYKEKREAINRITKENVPTIIYKMSNHIEDNSDQNPW